jgi:alkylation response protein AidB-like acyl-CoA dehydrogenase
MTSTATTPASGVVDALGAALTRVLGAPSASATTAVVWNAVASGHANDAGVVASAVGRSWQLTGTVATVLVPARLDTLLVVSRSRPQGGRDRGMRVHRVAVDAPGVRILPRPLLGADARTVGLEGVDVRDRDALGPSRDASGALAAAFDAALVTVVAEMLDAAESALACAVDWTTTRVQFGASLATRQAVQHRAADMVLACTAVRALLDDARALVEQGRPAMVETVVAKLVASDRLPAVTAAAHQLHGGEGYYADRPLASLHRRVLTLAGLFGDAATQRARLAALLA